jgi:hypothetical protein
MCGDLIANNYSIISHLQHITLIMSIPATPDMPIDVVLENRESDINHLLQGLGPDYTHLIPVIQEEVVKWPMLGRFIRMCEQLQKDNMRCLVLANSETTSQEYIVPGDVASISFQQFDDKDDSDALDEKSGTENIPGTDDHTEYKAAIAKFVSNVKAPTSLEIQISFLTTMKTSHTEEILNVLLALMIGPNGKIVAGTMPDVRVCADASPEEDGQLLKRRKPTTTTITVLPLSISFVILGGRHKYEVPCKMKLATLPYLFLSEKEYGCHIKEMAENWSTYNITGHAKYLGVEQAILFYLLVLQPLPKHSDKAPTHKPLLKRIADESRLDQFSTTDPVSIHWFTPRYVEIHRSHPSDQVSSYYNELKETNRKNAILQ